MEKIILKEGFKMNFEALKNIILDDLVMPIAPLRKGKLASEYGSQIIDYSKGAFSYSNRIIPPYNSTQTHGDDCYNRLLEYIRRTYTEGNILDLGCGSGELLRKIQQITKINKESLYGSSICVGEVKHARAIFNLPNVIPGDLRKCAEIFNDIKFDIIIFHCVFQFIPEEERTAAMNSAATLLNNNGRILVVDYRNDPCVKLEKEDLIKSFTINVINDEGQVSMGDLTEYKVR